MLKKLIPSYHANRIFLIDYPRLQSRGISNIFFDLDNTLSAYYEQTPHPSLISFIHQLKAQGFQVFVISNNHEKRVAKFAEPLKVDYLYETRKPGIKRLGNFIKQKNLAYDTCVLIGDQLLTDVICANSLGIHSILVEPFVTKDLPITRINRFFDKRIRRKLAKNGLLHNIEKEE